MFSKHIQDGNARAGLISINGIQVPTPVFMPVGTKLLSRLSMLAN